MTIRNVEGWDLRSRDGAAWWIRDVDLAERAGLAVPRDIRRTIAKLIKTRVLIDASKGRVGAAHALW